MSEGMNRTLLVGVLALAVLPGCPSTTDATGSTGTVSHSGSTSGDESEGDLERPPGSREPDSDGSAPTGDFMGDEGSSATADSSGGTGGSSSSATGPSPWGTPDSESGEALPERRPMTGSALSSYRDGVRLANDGQTAAARARFEAALSSDSGAFRAAYNLGVLYDREGNEARALEYYRQALRIQPDYELALQGIVAISIRHNNAAEAVSTTRPIADRWVRNLEVQAIYGRALVEAHREAEAVDIARRALRRDERSVANLRVLIAANLSLGRRELAISILDQAMGIDGDDAELHYFRARIRQEDGNLRDAIEEYRRAVALRSDYADARMALGILLLAGANYGEAVTQFEAVSRLAPQEAEVHLNLGDAYRSTKNWEKAKASFDRVIALDSNNAPVHFNLALMYMARAQAVEETDRAQALQFFTQAQQEFTSYRSLMGSRMARDDQSTEYLAELTRAIERTNRAIERDRARAERDAARAARDAAAGSGGGAGE